MGVGDEELDNDLILNGREEIQYVIVVGNGTDYREEQRCVIFTQDRREIELLLLILQTEAGVRMCEALAKDYPDIWDWLNGKTYGQFFSESKWTYREEEEVLRIIERIPLPPLLSKELLQARSEGEEPEPIESGFVHKQESNNVLISKPHVCGRMFYFNGFADSSEFNIDHGSDHLEGIIIFEAARQCGIASVHLAGVPLEGTIVLLKVTTSYSKFVEVGIPYIIRTIPVIKLRGGYSYCVYNVIQGDIICSTGYLTGIVYKNKESYEKFRRTRMMDKIQNRRQEAKAVHESANVLSV